MPTPPPEQFEPLDAEAQATAFEQRFSGLDPLSQKISRALRKLDAILARRGWDLPPALWAVSRDPQAAAGDELKLRWDLVPTGDILTSGHPSEALEWLVKQAEATPRTLPGLVGFAFVSEGWMVVPDSAARMERVTALAAGRKLYTDPDRIEVRIITCVDVFGVSYAHTMSRDPLKVGRTESVARIGEKGSAGLAFGGYVMESLERLVKAATGSS